MNIVEVQLLIIVFSGQYGSPTDCGPILGIVGLESLPVIIVNKVDIIYIVVKIGILLDRLVEPLERIVEVGRLSDAVDDRVETHVHTVVNLLRVVLHLVVVDTVALVSTSQTLVLTRHVHLPHLVNSLVDVAVVVLLSRISRRQQPEKNIVSFELEDGYSNH